MSGRMLRLKWTKTSSGNQWRVALKDAAMGCVLQLLLFPKLMNTSGLPKARPESCLSSCGRLDGVKTHCVLVPDGMLYREQRGKTGNARRDQVAD